jgi:hypothetical protein
LLDEPEVLAAFADGWDDIEVVRKAGVAGHEVAERGLLPVDVERGVI